MVCVCVCVWVDGCVPDSGATRKIPGHRYATGLGNGYAGHLQGNKVFFTTNFIN